MQPKAKNSLADSFRQLRETRFGSFVPVLLALIAIWVYFGLTQPAFLSPRNFYFLFMQSAVVGTLAVGITVVLLLGDIDLSAAATAGVCAALLAVLIVAGVPGWTACILAMILGTMMGTAQGLLVAYIGIPSFVVTLAGLLGFQGLMLKILGIQGAINMRDPIVRGLTTVALPPTLGWLLAATCLTGFAVVLLRRQSQRRARGLELEGCRRPLGADRVLRYSVGCSCRHPQQLQGRTAPSCPVDGLDSTPRFHHHVDPIWPFAVRRRR